jgi:general secretion pathway protein F
MTAFPAAEFAEFNALLASAAERGLPLEPALALLAAQAGSPRVRAALETVHRGLRDGKPLPEALRACPEFPPDYAALVEAGLAGGRLADVLRGAATHHGLVARVGAKFRRFGIYLALGFGLALALFGVGAGLSGRLDHLVGDLYGFRGREESWFEWMVRNPFRVLALLRFATRRRPGYWIPLWGRLLRSRDLALFCNVMGLRLAGGATLPDALASAGAAVPNRHARRMIGKLAERSREGASLSDALFYVRWFPRTLAWSVSLGERRGELPQVFSALGKVYGSETDRAFEMLFVILTPLGLVAVGNLAFFAVFATLAPFIQVVGMLGFLR